MFSQDSYVLLRVITNLSRNLLDRYSLTNYVSECLRSWLGLERIRICLVILRDTYLVVLRLIRIFIWRSSLVVLKDLRLVLLDLVGTIRKEISMKWLGVVKCLVEVVKGILALLRRKRT